MNVISRNDSDWYENKGVKTLTSKDLIVDFKMCFDSEILGFI